jgi:hypothetical protein
VGKGRVINSGVRTRQEGEEERGGGKRGGKEDKEEG